jgi:hypothetical protein
MGGDHIKALIRWRFDWVGGSVIRFGHRYLTLREARGVEEMVESWEEMENRYFRG